MPVLETVCLVLAMLGAENRRETADLLQQAFCPAKLADSSQLEETTRRQASSTEPISDGQLVAPAPALREKQLWREASLFGEARHRQDAARGIAYGLALRLLQTGRSEKGIETLRHCGSGDCSCDGLMSLAALHQKKGDLPAAVRLLEKCVEQSPKLPAAYLALGKLHQETSQPYRAYEVYKAAIDQGLKNPEMLYRQAELIIALSGAGKFAASDLPTRVAEAHQILLRLVEAKIVDARTHNLMGLALSQLGRDQEAREEFAKALRMDASNLDYAFNLSFQQQKLGQPAAAIELLRKVIVQQPNNVEAYDRLVWGYLRTARSDAEAESAVTVLLSLDQARSRSHLLAGNFYEGRGDLKRANQYYDSFIALEPASFEGHFAKGKVLLQQGELRDAEASLVEAVKFNPKHTDSLLELGKIYLRQGRVADAERAFLAASAHDPSHLQAHFQLGTLYRRKGELDKARLELELYEKLKQGRP